MKFTNKIILITGASSGIGYELAKQLADQKCKLALLARSKDVLDKLAEELKDTSSAIITIRCDVTDKQNVFSSFNEVINTFGGIDIAILNSGTSQRATIDNFNSGQGEETYKVNVFGLIYGVEALLPQLKKQRSGMIVGVSSLADARGYPKSSFYCSSKAAASTFLESIRVEMKKYNVKVLTVKPGFVKTPMTDKNEFYMPLLMPVEKGVKIILKGIRKEKSLIRFPFALTAATQIVHLLPNRIYDFLAYRHYKSLSNVKSRI